MKYRGYEIKAKRGSYSVYKDGKLAAAGGVVFRGVKDNAREARHAVDEIWNGSRSALNIGENREQKTPQSA